MREYIVEQTVIEQVELAAAADTNYKGFALFKLADMGDILTVESSIDFDGVTVTQLDWWITDDGVLISADPAETGVVASNIGQPLVDSPTHVLATHQDNIKAAVGGDYKVDSTSIEPTLADQNDRNGSDLRLWVKKNFNGTGTVEYRFHVKAKVRI